MARPEPHESFRELLLSDDLKRLFMKAYTTWCCSESEMKGEPISRMTKEEAELFIKHMDVVTGDEGTLLKRRYYRPYSSFIAEARWVTATVAMVMPDAEAVEIEQEKKFQRANRDDRQLVILYACYVICDFH